MTGMLERWRDLVRAEQWYAPFVDWSFLAYVSACAARRVWLVRGSDYEYPTVYVMFVGAPSSKKTSAAKAPLDLIGKLQKHRPFVAADVLTPAAWILEMQDSAAALEEDPPQAPLFVLGREFSTVLRDIGGGSPLDLLLSLYDGRATGATFKKRTISGGIVELPNPAVTVLGCTTIDGLAHSRILDAGFTGFISRFITVYCGVPVPGVFDRQPQNVAACVELAGALDRISLLKGPMHLSAGALDCLRQAWEVASEEAKRADLPTWREEYLGRKLTQITKVAMLFALMRFSMQLEAADVEQAQALIEATESGLSRVYARRVSYKDAAIESRVLDAFARGGPVQTEREFLKNLSRNAIVPMDSDLVNVLDALERSGDITVTRATNGKTFEKKGS